MNLDQLPVPVDGKLSLEERNYRLALRHYENKEFAQAMRIWEALAWDQDPRWSLESVRRLAICYLNGEGTVRDIPRAISFLRYVALNNGHVETLYKLGILYKLGQKEPRELQEARDKLKTLHTQGKELPKELQEKHDKLKMRYKPGRLEELKEAQDKLGILYPMCGEAVKDLKEAHEFFRLAAKQGHAESLFELNLLEKEYEEAAAQGNYHRGCQSEAQGDIKQAIEHYSLAVRQWHVEACSKLGDCYLKGGPGVEVDLNMAFASYRAGAVRGDPEAQYQLANCYLLGKGVKPSDPKQACEWFEKAAKLEHLDAAASAGVLCSKGYPGVSSDPIKAFRFFKQAADGGHPNGQFNLGFCYWMGTGTGAAPNKKKAIRLFKRSASQGYAAALLKLSMCYWEGIPNLIPENKEMALNYCVRAANTGDTEAQCRLGSIYEAGEKGLTNRDIEKAKFYYNQAARNHHPEAQYRLGMLYKEGKSVEEAAELIEMAALQGHTLAQYELAMFYFNGTAKKIPSDLPKAREWFQEALKGFKREDAIDLKTTGELIQNVQTMIQSIEKTLEQVRGTDSKVELEVQFKLKEDEKRRALSVEKPVLFAANSAAGSGSAALPKQPMPAASAASSPNLK